MCYCSLKEGIQTNNSMTAKQDKGLQWCGSAARKYRKNIK